MALQNKVREYREARKIKLRELARAVDIDHSQLWKVEAGLVGCSDERKMRLAKYFGVGVGELFFQPSVESWETAVPA